MLRKFGWKVDFVMLAMKMERLYLEVEAGSSSNTPPRVLLAQALSREVLRNSDFLEGEELKECRQHIPSPSQCICRTLTGPLPLGGGYVSAKSAT